MAFVHPFDPLTAEEIFQVSRLIRNSWPADTKLDFRSISLYEPEKASMTIYLDAEHADSPQSGKLAPPREARVVYYSGAPPRLHEAIASITSTQILEDTILPPGTFANMSMGDAEAVIRSCLGHPKVIKEIERIGVPLEGVVCEPWPYGSDRDDDGRRKYQCYMFTRDPKKLENQESNFYAFPLDFSPIFDADTLELKEVLYLPIDGKRRDSDSGLETAERDPSEYLPEAQNLRQDLRDLYIVQPDGPSFTTAQNLVRWQKWSFRVGFNDREGLILYDVHIDGRSAFYRLALSDMFVPYSDPRPPFHRKSAFDFGDAGAGFTANSLALGCDCLGTIKYFDFPLSDAEGRPYQRKHVVCMHEQDDLLAWKHTLPSGRPVGTRSRVLVLQTISTLANYDYIFMWIFDQAGGINFEIRATGIMSVQPAMLHSRETYDYGTIVHPGVAAPSHQHIFCLRIDPAVDGYNNQIIQADTRAVPHDEVTNPYDVGFKTEKISLTCAGKFDSDVTAGRYWLITNPGKLHEFTGSPTAWKLHPHNSQMLLAGEKSLHASRAGFAKHQLHLTKYNRRELYASGNYTNQSRVDRGVASWAARGEDLEGDVVLWHSFGITHVPRPEDFPVMPIAKLNVKLEPSGFFLKNPTLDVPPSSNKALPPTVPKDIHNREVF